MSAFKKLFGKKSAKEEKKVEKDILLPSAVSEEKELVIERVETDEERLDEKRKQRLRELAGKNHLYFILLFVDLELALCYWWT